MERSRLSLCAAGLLVACGPKLDPLAELKTELAAVGASEPQAAVSLDGEALSSMGSELLGRPHTAPGPLGMAIVVVPTLERTELSLAPGPSAGEVWVHAEVDGTLDIAFPLASQDDLAFEGRLDAPVVASVRPDPRGSWVLLSWAPGAPVASHVVLPGSTEQLQALTSGIVQGALEGALREPRGALIPTTPWGPILGVELGTDEGDLHAHVTVAHALGARTEPVDPPPGGFAVALSDASAQGLLRGLAATSQDEETYVVDPLSVQFDDGTVTAELRVHKRARRERWRHYRLEGPIRWEAGRLAIAEPTLELVEARGWRRGVSVAVGEKRAVSLLEEGVGGLPSALAQPLTADLALQLEIAEVSAEEGRVVVSGPVRVVPRVRAGGPPPTGAR